MPYKNTTKTPREIGRELGVDTLLTGSAMMIGDSVRITAQLIDTETEKHLWADSYQRDLSDIFALQNEVAGEISSAIEISLTPEETKLLARERPVDPEAHRLYLRGRYAMEQWHPDEAQKAVDLFEQSIALDPTSALPYAGLAEAYAQIKTFSVPPHEVMPKARAAAVRAVELDPNLGEAHAALGMVKLEYDFDWEGAETAFRRAIELKPSLPLAHLYLAGHLAAAGRPEEAIPELELAQRLDPLSPFISSFAGFIYYFAGEYEKAAEAAKASLEILPENPMAQVALGMAYEMQGRVREADAALEKAREIGGDLSYTLEFLAGAKIALGRTEEAREILADLVALTEEQYVCAYEVSTVYAGLGDTEEALQWLAKGIEDRADCLPWARTDPKLDTLRDNPRFQELMQQVGPGG